MSRRRFLLRQPHRAPSHADSQPHSENGDAWSCVSTPFSPPQLAIAHLVPDFTYDDARSRTYRWGEDGIAGVSDTHGRLNIAFAFWNEKEYLPLFPFLPSFSPATC